MLDETLKSKIKIVLKGIKPYPENIHLKEKFVTGVEFELNVINNKEEKIKNILFTTYNKKEFTNFLTKLLNIKRNDKSRSNKYEMNFIKTNCLESSKAIFPIEDFDITILIKNLEKVISNKKEISK